MNERDDERLWRRLRRVFRLPFSRARLDSELDEELRFHLEGRIEELMRRDGLTRAAAEHQARKLFGDVSSYKREARAIDIAMNERRQRMEIRDTMFRETRLAARALRRSPAFSLIALLTLGLGLGATTAIFTLLDAVVLRPLPYANADRLVELSSPVPKLKGQSRWGLARHEMYFFLDQGRTMENIGVFQVSGVTVTGAKSGDAPEHVRWVQTSASLLDVLGFQPARGRLLIPDDNHARVPAVAVLSYGYWSRRYAGDPGVIGTSISIEGFPVTIVGVLPQGAELPGEHVDIWAPAHVDSTTTYNNHTWSAYGRLRPGVTAADATRELAALTQRMPEVYPQVYGPNFMKGTGFTTEVTPLRTAIVGDLVTRSLWTLFGAVALVLLIAGANVANLFLVRIEARRREMAVRIALGADRVQLAFHYVAESMLLAAAAATVAVGVSSAMVRLMIATAPAELPRLAEVHLGWASVAFAVGVSLLAGLVFGVLPLWSARPDMATLRQSSRGMTASRTRLAARRTLVATQMALAVVLLASAGLMLQTFRNLRAVKLGFDPRGVLVTQISLPEQAYGNDAVKASALLEQLAARVRMQPGVTQVGYGDRLPLVQDDWCTGINIEAPDNADGLVGTCPPTSLVSPGYFEAMGIAIQGRTLEWSGMNSGDGGMIVSHAFANHHWPNESAIGKRINFNRGPFYHIVGVADDITQGTVDGRALEVVYFPMRPLDNAKRIGTPIGTSLVVRTSADNPIALVPTVTRLLSELEPQGSVYRAQTMETTVAHSMARHSFTMVLLLISALVAMVLSAVGIYGVISYIVGQRRGEIGIRMALGAGVVQIRSMIVGESLGLCVAGIVAGLVAAIVVTRVLGTLLYGVRPSDPLTLGVVTLVLVIVSVAASYVPARRASRADPSEALRSD